MIQICPDCGKKNYSSRKYGNNFCAWCGGILNVEMARMLVEDNKKNLENYSRGVIFYKNICEEHAFKFCKQFGIESSEKNYIAYCEEHLNFSWHYKTYNAYKEMLLDAIKMQKMVIETTKNIIQKLKKLENIQVIENTQLKLSVS